MKKSFIRLAALLLTAGCVGCSAEKTDTQENADYLRCNQTSLFGNMAETEDGFFYLCGSILYYADKKDMNNWVAVCNKPNCSHTSDECNAWVNYEIAQKDGKLYTVYLEDGEIHVYEIPADGSGKQDVYTIPRENNNHIESFRGTINQNQLVVYYQEMTDDGMFEKKLVRLDGETPHTLFTKTVDEYAGELCLSASYCGVRGEDVMIASLLTEEDEDCYNILWRVDGDVPERVNIPEGTEVQNSYLSGNEFIYFKQNEGFYQIDLTTGEEKLVSENQLKDSTGHVLTDQYMAESDWCLGYTSDNPTLKFYNGNTWKDVKLPEEAKNPEASFYPVAVASDRIFFRSYYSYNREGKTRLYYFLLEEESPELIFCSEFASPA